MVIKNIPSTNTREKIKDKKAMTYLKKNSLQICNLLKFAIILQRSMPDKSCLHMRSVLIQNQKESNADSILKSMCFFPIKETMADTAVSETRTLHLPENCR